MIPTWAALSIVLYLLPLAISFVALAQPGRLAWRAALGVPTFVAVDLLVTLLLSRLMRLEIATLVSRGLWITGGSLMGYRRRSMVVAWWRNTDLRGWINPGVSALFAVWVSSILSLSCGLWDRWWHIPLVTSLGGQRAPFLNFFEQNEPLAYHYAGDALASMLQALSFAHIHSAYALSRMHDVLFGLIGLTLAGLLPRFGAKRLVWSLAATATVVLAGPATVLVQGDARPLFGKSIVNLLSLSFRPHVPVAYLSIVGFVGALLLPVISREAIRARETRAMLFASTALLALCDETSLALLGVLLAASTAEWLWGTGASICKREGDSTYAETDCKEFARAKLGEAPIPAYVDGSVWYAFAGCRPLRAQSTSRFHRVIHLGFPETGWPRLRKLEGWLGNAPLDLYCPRTIGGVTFDVHTMLYASTAVLLGMQAITFSMFSRAYAVGARLLTPNDFVASFLRVATLERGLMLGGVAVLVGLAGSVCAFFMWGHRSFGALVPSSMMRLVIPSLTSLAAGFQLIFASFFLGVLGVKHK